MWRPHLLKSPRQAPVDVIGVVILIWLGITLFTKRFRIPQKAAASPPAATGPEYVGGEPDTDGK